MRITLRPESPAADDEFVRHLVVETIAGELGAHHWPERLRSQVLGVQLATRRQGPRVSFPEGESRIILLDGQPAGWIYTATLDDTIWLAEIMVAPEQRGKGVGSAAIRQVLALAARSRKPVRLTVNVLNTGAIRLYERLGFRRTGGNEVQHEMEARP